MSEGDISQISVGEFETVSQLLASSESLQLAFIIMIVGILAIAAAYRKFSSLIKSKKIFYTRPHLSKFVQNAVLPFFAIALISSTNAYIQTSELFENDSNSLTMELTPEETFAKILNTFNILVVGYTISHLIPIMLTKRDKSILEKQEEFELINDWRDNRTPKSLQKILNSYLHHGIERLIQLNYSNLFQDFSNLYYLFLKVQVKLSLLFLLPPHHELL